MKINQKQTEFIEVALLAASDYIANNIEAICDEDYLDESDCVLLKVNEALDLLRTLKDENL